MRRNRKNNLKKEKIIMIASSAFVLAALTMTGVYMSGKDAESKDDGYTLDFTTLEESADDKAAEIAENNQVAQNNQFAQNTESIVSEPEVIEDDLDYMPLEVGSGQIEIPGLTKQTDAEKWAAEEEALLEEEALSEEDTLLNEEASLAGEETLEEAVAVEDGAEDSVATGGEAVAKSLAFSEADGILRPVSGEILMHYSMSSSIYFATLDQYKYNPAVVLDAEQGTPVNACADGKVVDIYTDPQLGNVVVIDLGDGYQATYGQLENVTVSLDSYVDEGDIIAYIAAPSKYYSVEGANLYFALKKDGTPVNPEVLFR